ncbi:ComEC/Rec2 family competence protein [Sphingomonas sp. ASY06-1R]|uniref:ComEC/Rec2 family competence protein n=1 Tax=Sphingomonas sp. ASY06-1R TaxID=3445771 RepID=UPI003FA26B22
MHVRRWFGQIELWLEAERDQLPLWLPVGIAIGIAAWFGLPDAHAWRIFMGIAGLCAVVAFFLARSGRAGRALAWLSAAALLGCALAWARSERVAAPVLSRTLVVTMTAKVNAVAKLPAKQKIRLLLAPEAQPTLPPQIRVSLDEKEVPAGIAPGARIAVRARVVPPPPPLLPGSYDFARVAWFQKIGATGKALGPARLVAPAPGGGGFTAWLGAQRARLTAHIQSQLAGSEGGVAAAFVTGDVGAIDEADADAFRQSGLAHLLSISGLHVTAVIAATMLLTLRLLALSQWLALRAPLLLIAAGAGALAGIGYTLLSGAEVPTIRSCVAALLVLAGIALGREAMTLRLVATGALIVLLVWPEVLVGPSFQLSFAAVTSIIAFHEHPRVRAWAAKREEGWARRLLREVAILLATGLLVEIALMPIAAYHFHRAGIYGAFANIIAIPLTTFVIMPLEALALLLDSVGLGGPVWWVTGKVLALLIGLARHVSALPGAVAALPSMPLGAFLLMVAGGLWIALWRTPVRRVGALPLMIGAAWALVTPAPDVLITGDGKHLAVRTADGALHLLRPRAGEYVRDQLGEGSGVKAEALDLDILPSARCTRDVCLASIARGGRAWHVLATRSPYMLDLEQVKSACAWADIAVSDRRLPRTCVPRWLKLDRVMLAQTGGVAIDLTRAKLRTVRADDRHPWNLRSSQLPTGPSARRSTGSPLHNNTPPRNAHEFRNAD